MRRGLLRLVLLASLAGCGGGGTTVEVLNGGRADRSDLAVLVTGDRAPLPTLALGERARVRVRPTGETSIILADLATGDTLTAYGYLEPGYGGYLAFEVSGDSAKLVRERWTGPGPL